MLKFLLMEKNQPQWRIVDEIIQTTYDFTEYNGSTVEKFIESFKFFMDYIEERSTKLARDTRTLHFNLSFTFNNQLFFFPKQTYRQHRLLDEFHFKYTVVEDYYFSSYPVDNIKCVSFCEELD